jgi:hypothetical protein
MASVCWQPAVEAARVRVEPTAAGQRARGTCFRAHRCIAGCKRCHALQAQGFRMAREMVGSLVGDAQACGSLDQPARAASAALRSLHDSPQPSPPAPAAP